jgi:hypothetical protein
MTSSINPKGKSVVREYAQSAEGEVRSSNTVETQSVGGTYMDLLT